jgi:hypothetical protein
MFSDVLVNLHFTVNLDAPAGSTSLNLVATNGSATTDLVDEQDGFLELAGPLTNAATDPVDGKLRISREEAVTARSGIVALDRQATQPERPDIARIELEHAASISPELADLALWDLMSEESEDGADPEDDQDLYGWLNEMENL